MPYSSSWPHPVSNRAVAGGESGEESTNASRCWLFDVDGGHVLVDAGLQIADRDRDIAALQ